MPALTMNSFNSLFERLTAATGPYNAAKVGELAFLGSVHTDIKAEAGRQGQTVRTYFPDVGPFTDQANNDWQPDSVNPNYVDFILKKRPGKALLITDFEQLQTETNIIEMWLDPLYKRGQEYANAEIASLLTPQNFNIYPPLVSQKAASIDVGTAANAWGILTSNKIPLRDGDAAILYHPVVHQSTLTDTSWYQENLVSAIIARETRQNVAEPGNPANQAFKFRREFDQQAPVGSTNLTGTVALTNGSTAVAGTGTTFTTQLPPGSILLANNQRYIVATVTNDTTATMAQYFTGATASGLTVARETYTSVAMHRYAIGLVLRPLEIPDSPVVRGRYINLRGIPLRVMVSYQHVHDGWLLSMDFGMVAGMLRPDFGIVIQS